MWQAQWHQRESKLARLKELPVPCKKLSYTSCPLQHKTSTWIRLSICYVSLLAIHSQISPSKVAGWLTAPANYGGQISHHLWCDQERTNRLGSLNGSSNVHLRLTLIWIVVNRITDSKELPISSAVFNDLVSTCKESYCQKRPFWSYEISIFMLMTVRTRPTYNDDPCDMDTMAAQYNTMQRKIMDDHTPDKTTTVNMNVLIKIRTTLDSQDPEPITIPRGPVKEDYMCISFQLLSEDDVGKLINQSPNKQCSGDPLFFLSSMTHEQMARFSPSNINTFSK